MKMKQEPNTRVFMVNYMQTRANIDVKLKEMSGNLEKGKTKYPAVLALW